MNITVPRKRNGQEGFTLVELMIVVAIIGILAVLAVFGVSKYVQNAKTGEARNALGMIAKSAVGAYEQERAAPGALNPGGVAGASRQFCGPAATTVPGAAGSVLNQKYQSTAAEWSAGTALVGWSCLKFSLTEPQYFMYGYNSVPATSFNGWAEGFLDGSATADAPTHGFSLGGQLAANGQIVVQPAMTETTTGQATNKGATPTLAAN